MPPSRETLKKSSSSPSGSPIRSNRADSGELPTVARDFAQMLARVAAQRLRANENEVKQEGSE
jgi:hypothetical protein